MATKTWTGSGSWDTAGNWNPSGVPGLTDDCVIDGSGDIDGGATNNDVESISVARTYTGSIGASGSPLVIDCTDLRHFSPGSAHFDGVYTTTVCRSDNMSSPGLVITSNATGFVWVARGRITCAASRVFIGYTNAIYNDVACTCSDVNSVWQQGGSCVIQDLTASSRVRVGAGTMKINDGISNFPTAFVMGGDVEYLGDDAWTTDIDIMGGRFTIRGEALDSGSTIRIFAGGTLNILESSVDSEPTILNYGGKITSPGAGLSPTDHRYA